MIVIRGQSYKVTNVNGSTTIEIAQHIEAWETSELSSQKLWTPKSLNRTGVLTLVTVMNRPDSTQTSKRYKCPTWITLGMVLVKLDLVLNQ